MNDDEGTSNVCDANSTDMMDDVKEADSDANPPADQLERCGRWLSSIPRDDVQELRQTQEYHAFLRAFERLGNAHRRVISLTRSSGEMEDAPNIARLTFTPEFYVSPTPNNFLQHLTAEDVVLRIFEFLECHSLIRTASTCSRFRQLAHCSATQRTCDVAHSRQLNSVMQLLRAKEQIDGVGCGIHHSHVRVPILLLSRRVLVTNAGDPDYNGVYFCTGSNGNGFVFTKPRFPERRVQRILRQRQHIHHPPLVEGMHPFPQLPDPLQPLQEGAALVAGPRMEEGPTARFESEVAQPGQLLRCVIAKRFSNETILWYLSKEIESTETRGGVTEVEVTQLFSFWSKLMVIGDASPDTCRYPSQTSILARHNERWQALATTRTTRAPIVELLE